MGQQLRSHLICSRIAGISSKKIINNQLLYQPMISAIINLAEYDEMVCCLKLFISIITSIPFPRDSWQEMAQLREKLNLITNANQSTHTHQCLDSACRGRQPAQITVPIYLSYTHDYIIIIVIGLFQMKTRKKIKQEQQTTVVPHKPVELKLRINRFLNPSTTYRIFNNFFIKEEMLSKTLQKQVPHESYFEFNRIVKGKVVGNFIQFTVIPTSREFEFNDDYIIERFLSFGNEAYKKFADAMIVLKNLRKEIKSAIDEFPKFEKVIQRFNSEKPMIVWYDDPANFSPDIRNSPTSLLISLPYMKRYGWTNPQEYIFNCIKSGNLCLPFLVDTRSSQPYIDRMQVKIESIVNEIQEAISRKKLKYLESSASEGDTHLEEKQTTVEPYVKSSHPRMMEIHQEFKTHAETVILEFFQSPFMLCSQHVEYKSHHFTPGQIDRIISKCDSEEYDLLQKLIHVPQNRLERFSNKVCAFREVSVKMEEPYESH